MSNDQEIKRIVREAVFETLIGLGFDINEVHENQADMIYLRRLRKGSEDMAERIKGAVIAVSIPTILFMIWQTIKDMLRN